MINSRVLEDLLQKPLGPYRDCDVLHERLQGPKELILYSFVLEHDGRITGLDKSELGRQDSRRFRFRGTLKIANPSWLSDFGLKAIEDELNLRAKERALRLGEGTRMPELTLAYLFDKHLKKAPDSSRKEGETCLEVRIQGERGMSANFMFSTKVPNGLLWSSKAHNREYQVATMDVETYSLSEKFFWRWRLLALMERIGVLYQYVDSRKRTPGWFVEKYMQHFACPPEDKHRRLIFDEEDSDVDEMGKTKLPRHLLKPHQSEILGLFAAHAGWLTTNSAVRRRPKLLLDTTSWTRFASEAKNASKEAAKERITWGCPTLAGQQEEESSEEDEGDEDNLRRMVRENPVIAKPNQAIVRRIQRAQARLELETRPSYSSDSESDGDAPAGGAEYLSDFSEPSDGEDSDYQLAEEEVVDRIPWQLQVPADLPDVDGRWWCPLEECGYEVNLYDLQEEEIRGVPPELVGYIQRKEWRNAPYDERVMKGFIRMVTNHYHKHIEEHGIKVTENEGRTRYTLVDDGRRRRGPGEPIRGPMPPRGSLPGESRVIPIVHVPQVEHF